MATFEVPTDLGVTDQTNYYFDGLVHLKDRAVETVQNIRRSGKIGAFMKAAGNAISNGIGTAIEFVGEGYNTAVDKAVEGLVAIDGLKYKKELAAQNPTLFHKDMNGFNIYTEIPEKGSPLGIMTLSLYLANRRRDNSHTEYGDAAYYVNDTQLILDLKNKINDHIEITDEDRVRKDMDYIITNRANEVKKAHSAEENRIKDESLPLLRHLTELNRNEILEAYELDRVGINIDELYESRTGTKEHREIMLVSVVDYLLQNNCIAGEILHDETKHRIIYRPQNSDNNDIVLSSRDFETSRYDSHKITQMSRIASGKAA